MILDLEKLSALFDLLAAKDIAEFEQEEGGARVRVARGARVVAGAVAGPLVAAAPGAPAVAPVAAVAATANALDYVDVTSPFVGSFYRAPSPDVPPFVEIGTVVVPGQTLCIIEAMKLMNEIEADCAGIVTEIFTQNGKNVEYGQKIFRIKRA
jgi:acetyl-CoA carboxylase biotin carboxyl carrier protein